MKNYGKLPKKTTNTTKSRFYSRIIQNSLIHECWEYTGKPLFWISELNKCIRFTRAAWFIKFGELPSKEKAITRVCKNSHCVNPEHLQLTKTTDLFKFNNPKKKLTDTQIDIIKIKHALGWTQVELGKEFLVTTRTIYNILSKAHIHLKPASTPVGSTISPPDCRTTPGI